MELLLPEMATRAHRKCPGRAIVRPRPYAANGIFLKLRPALRTVSFVMGEIGRYVSGKIMSNECCCFLLSRRCRRFGARVGLRPATSSDLHSYRHDRV
ncbi:hypothetical protein EVAR_55670_1 [Eumeta japonica]|uniref:Uncharacterized protein n=1 Tax=Eumeta variegata TaxID=151549 RepID=A0A4C2A0C7_EUMVA|nr:hypothetical protein EVAR_55670_1 [Eumeta japonica]